MRLGGLLLGTLLVIALVAQATGTFTFSAPVRLTTNHGYVGGSIATNASDGLFLVNGHGVDALKPFLAWKSSNNGSTWTDISPPSGLTASGGAEDLAIDSCGNLYVASTSLTYNHVFVWESSNQGASWTKRDLTALTPAAGSPWEPAIVGGACGEAYLVHTTLGYPLSSQIGALYRASNGTWSAGAAFDIGNLEMSREYVLHGGTLHVLYVGANNVLKVAKSTDNGTTFSHNTVSSQATPSAPTLGADASGNLYAGWRHNSSTIRFASSTNGGSTVVRSIERFISGCRQPRPDLGGQGNRAASAEAARRSRPRASRGAAAPRLGAGRGCGPNSAACTTAAKAQASMSLGAH